MIIGLYDVNYQALDDMHKAKSALREMFTKALCCNVLYIVKCTVTSIQLMTLYFSLSHVEGVK